MKQDRRNQGFTLAELLVVVAIIGVLVAIAIPTFTAQLEKARLAVDDTHIREAYAYVQLANMTGQLEVDGVSITPTRTQFDPKYTSFYFTTGGTLTPKRSDGVMEHGYKLQAGHIDCHIPPITVDKAVAPFQHKKNSYIWVIYSFEDKVFYLANNGTTK